MHLLTYGGQRTTLSELVLSLHPVGLEYQTQVVTFDGPAKPSHQPLTIVKEESMIRFRFQDIIGNCKEYFVKDEDRHEGAPKRILQFQMQDDSVNQASNNKVEGADPGHALKV